jgi:hypothetical protein
MGAISSAPFDVSFRQTQQREAATRWATLRSEALGGLQISRMKPFFQLGLALSDSLNHFAIAAVVWRAFGVLSFTKPAILRFENQLSREAV